MYKFLNLFFGKLKLYCNVEVLKVFFFYFNKGLSEIIIVNVYIISNVYKVFFLVIIFFIDFIIVKYLLMEIVVCVNIVL